MEPWAPHRTRVPGLWHGRGRVLGTGLYEAGTASLGHKQEGSLRLSCSGETVPSPLFWFL